ncbi:hypothetical protein MMC19_004002 [Ptychographa xylographoides]|nr:hypothetical protein [Ptychographa xylographoides]
MYLTALCLFASSALVSGHTVITYPGWRGDNLHTNGTQDEFAASGGLGVGPNNTFPYGMQWMYPCGGMPLTENRTLWPVTGGAVAIQPGWFQGHATAYFYINLGEGTLPTNMSLPMVPVFEITGPTRQEYAGGFCLPQVPLPAGYVANIGDNATIQVVETAVHGAALYSCVDITFADPLDVAEVNASNCANSSDIGFQLVYTTTSLGAASSYTIPASWLVSIPLTAALLWGILS